MEFDCNFPESVCHPSMDLLCASAHTPRSATKINTLCGGGFWPGAHSKKQRLNEQHKHTRQKNGQTQAEMVLFTATAAPSSKPSNTHTTIIF
jgi:hypothetical protein